MKTSYTLLLFLFCLFLSCSKDQTIPEPPQAPTAFKNIVVLGNSITYSPASPEVDWHGNWGMAATAPELDFVHLLTKRFQTQNPNAKLTAKNISLFEVDYANYAIEQELAILKAQQPDLLILRIGENVSLETFQKALFENRYQLLIDYFKQNNPTLKVVAAGSFWGNIPVDQVMAAHSPFITLSTLNLDMSNYAWGQFTNHGVASHPSDKGMAAISDLIWAEVQKL